MRSHTCLVVLACAIFTASLVPCTTATWQRLSPSSDGPLPRYEGHMVQLYGSLHLVFGGFPTCCSHPRASPNDLWAFDSTTAEWVQLIGDGEPGSPPGRSQAAVAGVAHGFLIYGGFDDHGHVFDTVWRYNYSANAWTALTSRGGPRNSRYAPGAAGVSGGMLLFGGLTLPVSPFQPHNDVWFFNLAANTWKRLTGDSTSKSVPGPVGQVMCASVGEFDITGSTDATQMACYGGWEYQPPVSPERPFGSMWRFDMSSLQWDLLAPNASTPSPLPRLSGRLASNGTHGLLFAGEAQVGIGPIPSMGPGNHAMLNSVSDLWAFPLNAPAVNAEDPHQGASGWVQLAENTAPDGPGARSNPLFAMQGGGSCVVATGGLRQVRFPQEPQVIYTDVWQWCA